MHELSSLSLKAKQEGAESQQLEVLMPFSQSSHRVIAVGNNHKA